MFFRPYSYSRLSTYSQCPKKFNYKYHLKLTPAPTDKTALLKGGAVHSILENYPYPTTHKLAPKYQKIVDNFIKTNLGQQYLFRDSTREYDFGLTYDLKPTDYNDKAALFRGSVDYVCIIDNIKEEILEVDSIDDIPDGYEFIEKSNTGGGRPMKVKVRKKEPILNLVDW